ncbi:MAG: Fur family transcriptional regulator [Ahrensia sp.]|nr:Fur family transcriptional regulator [Ahrensia sp.]
MTKRTDIGADLTKNQSLVMSALAGSKGPMSAYSILDEIRSDGVRAPLQVYRALDKLVEFGLVHRLESLNAFVACQHPACDGRKEKTVLFTICETCGGVQELVKDRLSKAIEGLARELEFSPSKSTIELRGMCSACKTATEN